MAIEFLMPFYGSFELFRAAVESVRNQDDEDWILTVVDDKYPDLAPGRWVQSLNDPRIRYIRNETNLGVSGNFRKCADLATEQWVCIIGCDDIALPGYVGRMKTVAAAHPQADYIQPGVSIISEDGRLIRPLPDRIKAVYAPRKLPAVLSGEHLATSLSRACWTYFPSICWRREALAKFPFDADLDVALDLDVQLRIADAGGTLVADDDVTFQYRRHRASVSSWTANDGSRFDEERRVLENAADRAEAQGWRSARRAATRRWSSRFNAVTRLPSAIRAKDRRGVVSLMRHITR